MTGYVVLPSPWRDDPEEVRTWVNRSLQWAQTLPAKQPKPAKKRAP